MICCKIIVKMLWSQHFSKNRKYKKLRIGQDPKLGDIMLIKVEKEFIKIY